MTEGPSSSDKGWLQKIKTVLIRGIRDVNGTYLLKEHVDRRLNENGAHLSSNDMFIMNKLLELDQRITGIERDIASLRDVIEKLSARS